MSKFKFKIGDKVRVSGHSNVREQFIGKRGEILDDDNEPYVSFDHYISGTYKHDNHDYVYAFDQNNLELVEGKDQPEENAPDSITHTITIENQTIKLSHAGLRKLKNMLTGVEL